LIGAALNINTAIRILDLRTEKFLPQDVNRLIPRASLDISRAVEEISELLLEIKAKGSVPIVEITKKLDGVDPRPIRVTSSELSNALAGLGSPLRASLEEAVDRVRRVSLASVPNPFDVDLSHGARVSQRYVPVDSVGLYVPGGKAAYPSSVIMNVVPAQIAGVEDLHLASPAQKNFNGRPHPTVLATAALLGVDQVYCMGGPAAIAGFAFGLADIGLPPLAMVTGPGNIYVAAAKRALRGFIGIDSEAGTTEIMILADDSADAKFIAADLISQAEHDESAAIVLVTDSYELVQDVLTEISQQMEQARHRERISSALAGQQSALILVEEFDRAIEIANSYAPEHLEIQTRDNEAVLPKISNAGAVFLGGHSPVSLGDYMAGSNHVLPTGGQARFGSGLGVHSFLRPQQIVSYTAEGLSLVADKIVALAEAEDLPAHGSAVSARFKA
jgi:histidinol dehydrogenase